MFSPDGYSYGDVGAFAALETGEKWDLYAADDDYFH
jgi:hypothetical protein